MRDCPAYVKSLPRPPTDKLKHTIHPIPPRSLDPHGLRPTQRLQDEHWHVPADHGFIDSYDTVLNDEDMDPRHQYLYTIPSDDEGMYDGPSPDDVQVFQDFGHNMRNTPYEQNQVDIGEGGYSRQPQGHVRRWGPTSIHDLAHQETRPPSARGLRAGPIHATRMVKQVVGTSRDQHRIGSGVVPQSRLGMTSAQRHPRMAVQGPTQGFTRFPEGQAATQAPPVGTSQRAWGTTRAPTPGPSRLPSLRPPVEGTYYRHGDR
jgi:hypothetical protein